MASVEEMCDHISLINKARCIMQGEVSQIRREYGSGEYRLCFEGDGAALAEALEADGCRITGRRQGKCGAEITVRAASGSGNELLSKAISTVRVVSFCEILPGMNDIFISKVNEQ
jgi:ABC-2 type transport system ATP-binding protein